MNKNDNTCMFKKKPNAKNITQEICFEISLLMHIPNQYLKNDNKTNNNIL